MTTDLLRENWLPRIHASAQRALGGQTPASLLAYSVDLDLVRRLILLKAHFEGIPTEADIETMQRVDTEVLADFPDEFETRTEYEIVMPYYEPTVLAGDVVFRRKAAWQAA